MDLIQGDLWDPGTQDNVQFFESKVKKSLVIPPLRGKQKQQEHAETLIC